MLLGHDKASKPNKESGSQNYLQSVNTEVGWAQKQFYFKSCEMCILGWADC